ncbi:MAG: hypothetical protein FJZ58_05775 [Chlamydiae bacterium]|nr:hypothetical protein [Chlamydiota bacterium]
MLVSGLSSIKQALQQEVVTQSTVDAIRSALQLIEDKNTKRSDKEDLQEVLHTLHERLASPTSIVKDLSKKIQVLFSQGIRSFCQSLQQHGLSEERKEALALLQQAKLSSPSIEALKQRLNKALSSRDVLSNLCFLSIRNVEALLSYLLTDKKAERALFAYPLLLQELGKIISAVYTGNTAGPFWLQGIRNRITDSTVLSSEEKSKALTFLRQQELAILVSGVPSSGLPQVAREKTLLSELLTGKPFSVQTSQVKQHIEDVSQDIHALINERKALASTWEQEKQKLSCYEETGVPQPFLREIVLRKLQEPGLTSSQDAFHIFSHIACNLGPFPIDMAIFCSLYDEGIEELLDEEWQICQGEKHFTYCMTKPLEEYALSLFQNPNFLSLKRQ